MNKSGIFMRALLGIPYSMYTYDYKTTLLTIEPPIIHIIINLPALEPMTNVSLIPALKENEYYHNNFNVVDKNYTRSIYNFIMITPHDLDVKLFIKGKYSQISELGKMKIISFVRSRASKDQFSKILYPNDEMRQNLANNLDVDVKLIGQEIFDIPKESNEIINWNKYGEKRNQAIDELLLYERRLD